MRKAWNGFLALMGGIGTFLLMTLVVTEFAKAYERWPPFAGVVTLIITIIVIGTPTLIVFWCILTEEEK